ncbi:hypothetical protein ACFQX4_11770 [Roseomonas sp. GCM10028921]
MTTNKPDQEQCRSRKPCCGGRSAFLLGFAIATLTGGATIAQAPEGPTGLRGYMLGMTLAEARQVPHPDGIEGASFTCARASYNGHRTPPMDASRIRLFAEQSITNNTTALRHPSPKTSEQVLFFGGILCTLIRPPTPEDARYRRRSSPAEMSVAGAPSSLIFVFGPTGDFNRAQAEEEHRLMVIEGQVNLDPTLLLIALQHRYGPSEVHRERVRRFDGRDEIVETPFWRTRDGAYLLVAEGAGRISFQALALAADLASRFDAAVARERAALLNDAARERSKGL